MEPPHQPRAAVSGLPVEKSWGFNVSVRVEDEALDSVRGQEWELGSLY